MSAPQRVRGKGTTSRWWRREDRRHPDWHRFKPTVAIWNVVRAGAVVLLAWNDLTPAERKTFRADRRSLFFFGVPDRWYEKPHWRCTSGHVSTMLLKSEARGGSVCLACFAPVRLTHPEDVELPGVARHPTVDS